MRISNDKKRFYYATQFNILILVFIASIMFYFVDSSQLNLVGNWIFLLIGISGLSIMFFILKGNQIFEYDSDGEALNFINKNVIAFQKKIIKDEFPKYKLTNFNIINALLFKKLYISIHSKKEKKIIIKYDISFIKNKDLKDLKLSLNKVISQNKQNQQTT